MPSSSPVLVRPVREDIALLILRVTVALNLMLHGIAKIVHPESLGWISNQLTGKGLPGFLAYGVFVGELIAPALILVGVFTRPAAAVVMVTMFFAIFLAHGGEVTSLAETGAWAIETPIMFMMTALTLVLMGGGRFGLVKGQGTMH